MRIGVYNEAGELVKTLLVQHFAEPVEDISLGGNGVITTLKGPTGKVEVLYQGKVIGAWDGINGNGEPSPNGVYHIKVDNIDNLGSVVTTTQQVMISRSLYKATVLIYNEAGEIVRHLYSFVDDPGNSTVNGAQFSTSVIKPAFGVPPAGVPSQLTITLSTGATLVWDGRSDAGAFVQSGQYFVEIHSLNGAGADATVTKQVAVQAADILGGVGAITARPNVVDLTKGNGDVSFASSSTMGLTLRAGVYTTAGELTGIVEGGQGTGTINLNASKLASGLYLVIIEAGDSNGGFVAHQILKMVVIH